MGLSSEFSRIKVPIMQLQEEEDVSRKSFDSATLAHPLGTGHILRVRRNSIPLSHSRCVVPCLGFKPEPDIAEITPKDQTPTTTTTHRMDKVEDGQSDATTGSVHSHELWRTMGGEGLAGWMGSEVEWTGRWNRKRVIARGEGITIRRG